ncbi:hypothetical protein NE237_020248 [Protea cynaroides]|uniref:Uncharacterized protein n=1 Tax=Protea cynaroides TaxID=273540 RepID=A0A9Q0H8Q1_9MAGN|nr:hypothetical protein NE237_020248 [Protea cynaroides]
MSPVIVSDRKYYPVFKNYCQPPCYNDEHYIPTLINILSPEMTSNRSVTWVDWSKFGPHPGKFAQQQITVEFLINNIRFGSNCTYNNENTISICFLFARKFVSNTLKPLLQIAPVKILIRVYILVVLLFMFYHLFFHFIYNVISFYKKINSNEIFLVHSRRLWFLWFLLLLFRGVQLTWYQS